MPTFPSPSQPTVTVSVPVPTPMPTGNRPPPQSPSGFGGEAPLSVVPPTAPVHRVRSDRPHSLILPMIAD